MSVCLHLSCSFRLQQSWCVLPYGVGVALGQGEEIGSSLGDNSKLSVVIAEEEGLCYTLETGTRQGGGEGTRGDGNGA